MNTIIVEDHKIMSDGLKRILADLCPDINIVRVFDNGLDALRPFEAGIKIDFLITGLNMPKMNGIELIEAVNKYSPNTKVLVLTRYFNKSLVKRLQKLNVQAYVLKSSSESLFVEAVKIVQNGAFYYPTETDMVVTDVERRFSENGDRILDRLTEIYSLSKRELQISKLLVSNLTTTEISEEIGVTLDTLGTHRKNIYRKTGVHNVLDLYKLLASHGVISEQLVK